MNSPIKSLFMQLFCEMDSKNQSNALLMLIHYCKAICLPRNLAAFCIVCHRVRLLKQSAASFYDLKENPKHGCRFMGGQRDTSHLLIHLGHLFLSINSSIECPIKFLIKKSVDNNCSCDLISCCTQREKFPHNSRSQLIQLPSVLRSSGVRPVPCSSSFWFHYLLSTIQTVPLTEKSRKWPLSCSIDSLLMIDRGWR